MSVVLRLEGIVGATPEQCALGMAAVADRVGCMVELSFNGVCMLARPGQPAAEVADAFRRAVAAQDREPRAEAPPAKPAPRWREGAPEEAGWYWMREKNGASHEAPTLCAIGPLGVLTFGETAALDKVFFCADLFWSEPIAPPPCAEGGEAVSTPSA